MTKRLFTVLFMIALSYPAYTSDNRTVQNVKRIDGSPCLVTNGKIHKIDQSVVTVKKKNPVKPLDENIIILAENKLGYIDIRVPQGKDVMEYVEELKSTGDFEIVEYIGSCITQLIPNDSLSGTNNQWNLSRISVYNAWNITTGSPNIKVAIIDTGVDAGHPDLGYGTDIYTHIDTMNGWDYVNGTNYSTPSNEHGTIMAGVIGAKTNNNRGIAGIAGGNHSAGITIIPYN